MKSIIVSRVTVEADDSWLATSSNIVWTYHHEIHNSPEIAV